MGEEYKRDIILTTIIVIAVLIFLAIVSYRGYSDKKLEKDQPRYFIEFKGNVYELKEVE